MKTLIGHDIKWLSKALLKLCLQEDDRLISVGDSVWKFEDCGMIVHYSSPDHTKPSVSGPDWKVWTSWSDGCDTGIVTFEKYETSIDTCLTDLAVIRLCLS